MMMIMEEKSCNCFCVCSQILSGIIFFLSFCKLQQHKVMHWKSLDNCYQ